MRKLSVPWLLCLSLSSALLPCASVHAAPGIRTEDEATVAMARERFKEGVSFFDKKEYDKARVAFLQAYALKKHPAVLLNLAQSELRSGHEPEAAKHFSAYLREATTASDSEKQAAEAGLNATKSSVAEVAIAVDESGAEIYIDGTLEGLSPLPGSVYLSPGTHSVEARKAGKSTATQVNAPAGKATSATLSFAPKAALPPTPIADQPNGEPSSEPEPANSGGRKPFFSWLVSSPVGVVGLGLTGVGLGVGVGTALASNHAYNNADSVADQIKGTAARDSSPSTATSDLCSNPTAWLTRNNYGSNRVPTLAVRAGEYGNACTKYNDNKSSGDTLKTVATVGFIVGGVAAVGTIVYYFIDPNAREAASKGDAAASKRRIALVPSVAPTQAGLSLVGSF